MPYIDLSQAPYFDDFDETKKFARVLFKPAHPVQARELTQLQTIIQKQLERFGRHIFKEGSIVYGGQFDIDNQVPYIKVELTDAGSNTIVASSFRGTTLTGRITGIKAFVLDGGIYDDNGTEQNVLFIRYLSGNELSNVFAPGEVIETTGGIPGAELNAVVSDTSPSGFGSLFTIESGVVFTNNFFAAFDRQTIVLSPFSQSPSCRVGFEIENSIVTSAEDLTLLDNSQGFLNYASPGADRLSITPRLKTLAIDATAELPEFVELFTINDGVIRERYERPVYAIIGDEIAKRTFDESGDYCIRGMNTRIREHLNTGENEGYLLESEGGDSSLLAVGIEPGVAYVKGYEINKLVTSYVNVNKSYSSVFVNSQITSATVGSYISIKEIIGAPQLDTGSTVSFYSQAETRVTSKTASSASPTGSLLGTAKVRAIRYESGELGKPAGQMRLYLSDVKMSSGTFSSIKSVRADSPVNFFADVVLVENKAILNEQGTSPQIYNVGSNFVKTIRSENDTSDTVFSFQRSNHNITLSAGGTFTISVSTAGESFPYGVSALSSFDKQSILVSLNAGAISNQTGTVSCAAGSKNITGSGTYFTRLNIGDKLEISGASGIYTIATITSDTVMTLVENLSTSRTNVSFTKTYLAGDIIDLNSKGSTNGSVRSVTGTTATSLSFNLNETFTSTVNISVVFLVSRSSAFEIKKILRPSRYVKITCASLSDLVSPISLGFSDVYKIRQIKKNGSVFSAVTDGTDVTSNFIFDNGQRDDLYDHARITPRPGFSLSSGDYLLVELDYFYPDYSLGVGYFSVDSYPVDDDELSETALMTHEIPVYTSSTGISYDLRNHLDFRPIKQNTANDSTTLAGASTNPVASGAFVFESNGTRLPYPASQIVYDYSYYLSRRDVIVIDKNGKFSVIEGRADINPVTPSVPENVMGVAKLFIPPYPSLASTYARILGREDLGCSSSKITFDRHTMRDIGVIKNRVNRLEYYSTISLLETQTKELLILDENGEDRFKNGFFVDGFVDHSLGATSNDDYQCSIDKEEKVLRPFFKMNSFPYRYIAGSSSNVQQTGPLLTLPYTEVPYIEQTKATTYRNIEQSVFRFIGTIEMTPDTDVWVDTYTVDRQIYQDYSSDEISPMEIEWGAWEKYVTGYSIYNREFGDRSGEVNSNTPFIGTYSSYSDAIRGAINAGYSGTDSRYLLKIDGEESRSGTSLISTAFTEQHDLGSFVTDVSLVPYIRPQIIRLTVRGVKANTRFHVFFDGENMNDYLAPMVIPAEGPEAASQFLSEGSAWISNGYGELSGVLRLPSSGKRFRVGTREIMITDSPTNSVDTSSFAKGFFVAQGLVQQKQNTILSTKNAVVEQQVVTQSRTLQKTEILGPSCMAYSFFVKAPEGEDGIFLSSVEVFIQSLHASLGVWFEIREMNSAGGITRTQVPYSEVWMKRSDSRLKTSSTGLVPTIVNFQCPVFLLNDTQYAFVIHTEGLNPDTYFWISRLGEQDLITGQQVTARQLTGNVYTTNNNLNWDIVPDIDLKIKFNRASFNTSVTGTVTMGNTSNEFWNIADPSSLFVYFGETILGSDVIDLASISGSGAIEVGDTIVGTNSEKSAQVLRISANSYFMSDYGFETNEPITVTGKNSTATISGIVRGSAILSTFDRRTNTMYLTNSNGMFAEGMKFIGSTSSVTSTITSIGVNRYSTLNHQPSYILFSNTSCDFSVKGFDSAAQAMGNFLQIIPRSDFHFPKEQQLLSRSKEIQLLSGGPSSISKAELKTNSNWVSPIIDLSRSHSIFVSNIINDDITGEGNSSGGNLLNKYISRTVTLSEGQDAEDLVVSISAYCPPGITELFPIKVWTKIRHDEDGDQFNEKPWIEMVNSGEGVYSSVANKFDFRSYTFKLPAEMMIGQYGAVQYSSKGNTYDGFKQFAVKVGLLGIDSAQVPRVSDLKVIALQM